MYKKPVLIGISAMIAASFTLPILAPSTRPIEEILVTATKRAQTLQEVSVAVSVVEREVLGKAHIQDLKDLQ